MKKREKRKAARYIRTRKEGKKKKKKKIIDNVNYTFASNISHRGSPHHPSHPCPYQQPKAAWVRDILLLLEPFALAGGDGCDLALAVLPANCQHRLSTGSKSFVPLLVPCSALASLLLGQRCAALGEASEAGGHPG